MRLVELIAGLEYCDQALEVARATATAMGCHVIAAKDQPGFLINRCNRPFGLEALRLLQERIANVPDIDRIVRGAGFPMGPFELQDLVGIDIGLDVAKSLYDLSFGEPRWRPSPLVAQMVAAGRLGRKSGRGWYDYGNPSSPDEPRSEAVRGYERVEASSSSVIIRGSLPVVSELRRSAQRAGWSVVSTQHDLVTQPWLIVDCSPTARRDGAPSSPSSPHAVLCAGGSLHSLATGAAAVGFHALPPIGMVELTRTAATSAEAADRVEAFFRSLGYATIWVADAPGLVLGRIVAQVVNECAFAIGEGVGTAADIDFGMRHGLSYPRGPLEWADAIGVRHVLLVLDALRREYGEERYRVAPLLRRTATFHRSP